MIPVDYYLFLSLAVFVICVIGVLTRRNVIIMLMSIELILNAVNINLMAFSRLWGSVDGQVFAIFIITDAAAEAAVGLGIILAFFHNRETVLAGGMDIMKWRVLSDDPAVLPGSYLADPTVSAADGGSDAVLWPEARERRSELFVRGKRVCFVYFFGGRFFSTGGPA